MIQDISEFFIDSRSPLWTSISTMPSEAWLYQLIEVSIWQNVLTTSFNSILFLLGGYWTKDEYQSVGVFAWDGSPFGSVPLRQCYLQVIWIIKKTFSVSQIVGIPPPWFFQHSYRKLSQWDQLLLVVLQLPQEGGSHQLKGQLRSLLSGDSLPTTV